MCVASATSPFHFVPVCRRMRSKLFSSSHLLAFVRRKCATGREPPCQRPHSLMVWSQSVPAFLGTLKEFQWVDADFKVQCTSTSVHQQICCVWYTCTRVDFSDVWSCVPDGVTWSIGSFCSTWKGRVSLSAQLSSWVLCVYLWLVQ